MQRGKARIADSLRRLGHSYEKSGGKSGIAPSEVEAILARIRLSTARIDLLPCDIVIEAIVENETAKTEIITSLKAIGFAPILVSNTSSISITRLAAAYSYPERFMGMHFMNPVPLQPGCELIRGLLTSNETCERVTAFCRALGKEPIVAEDKAGFGINRIPWPERRRAGTSSPPPWPPS